MENSMELVVDKGRPIKIAILTIAMWCIANWAREVRGLVSVMVFAIAVISRVLASLLVLPVVSIVVTFLLSIKALLERLKKLLELDIYFKIDFLLPH